MTTESALTEALAAIQRDLGRIERDLRPLIREPLQREVDIGNLRQTVLLLKKDVSALVGKHKDAVLQSGAADVALRGEVSQMVERVDTLRHELMRAVFDAGRATGLRIDDVEDKADANSVAIGEMAHTFDLTKTRVLAWLAGAGFAGAMVEGLLEGLRALVNSGP